MKLLRWFRNLFSVQPRAGAAVYEIGTVGWSSCYWKDAGCVMGIQLVNPVRGDVLVEDEAIWVFEWVEVGPAYCSYFIAEVRRLGWLADFPEFNPCRSDGPACGGGSALVEPDSGARRG